MEDQNSKIRRYEQAEPSANAKNGQHHYCAFNPWTTPISLPWNKICEFLL